MLIGLSGLVLSLLSIIALLSNADLIRVSAEGISVTDDTILPLMNILALENSEETKFFERYGIKSCAVFAVPFTAELYGIEQGKRDVILASGVALAFCTIRSLT